MKKPYLNLALANEPITRKDKEQAYIAYMQEHISEVHKSIMKIQKALSKRAIKHDGTKLLEPELTAYAIFEAELKKLKKDSEKYQAILNNETYQLGKQHHYANNPHHPNHYANGVLGMSLIDILEMMADWRVDGKEDGEDYETTLENGREKYNIPDELFEIMKKTAEELEWM